MPQDLMNIVDVESLIANGRTLLLAGEEDLLHQLPRGDWIGGTIPYFITPSHGGMVSQDKVFVTDISDTAASIEIKPYDKNTLDTVYTEAGHGGYSFIIIPALSAAHAAFALNAPNYKDFGSQPLIGWISGIKLDDLGRVSPKVFNGPTGTVHEQEAIVMHVTIPQGKSVDVGIINIFEQGEGDTLTFSSDGFSCTEVMVNGVKENFADYISRNRLDTRLPLVADYYGAMVNISFQEIEPGGKVTFYAPVFAGIHYKHAKSMNDYAASFEKQLHINGVTGRHVVFSCNCILNYLYSGLEGKSTDPFVGPATFGEIAYQLLNQTLVYLLIQDIK